MVAPRRLSPWIAFALGALVALVVVLAWMGWSRSRGAAPDLAIAVPEAQLPIPKLPDAPRIPDAPVPTPR
ncbi:MAG: hypothetical protein ABW360_17475 [Phenylobacterium sp.]